MMVNGSIYNVNAQLSFLDVLADKFLREYAEKPETLAQVLFLLPTRRACQNLKDAFVRNSNLAPIILPRIEPVADIEEDEIFLNHEAKILQNIKPIMNKNERLFIFTKLILSKPAQWGTERISLSQAYALAQSLANLIDLTYEENLSFKNLADLVPEEYAEHWQETLKLLEIITDNWPKILESQNKEDAVKRKNNLLKAEMSMWHDQNTFSKIVIAGVTAPFLTLKELVKTVYELPNGEVYLYGLDKFSDEKIWEKIDENHPQYELKNLLNYLNIKRSQVEDLVPDFSNRTKLICEIMRPAQTTSAWRNLSSADFPLETFEGLHLMNCDDIRQEAQAIAMIIRQTLETEQKTVALVTADRNLSRRVVAELKKWNIPADDSAGQPLSLTPIGVYLRLIIYVIEQNFSQVSQLALMKHPFTACGMSKSEFNIMVRHLELCWRKQDDLSPELQEIIEKFQAILQPLAELYKQPQVNTEQLFQTHIMTAEKLAGNNLKTGDKIIWRGDSGSIAGKFINDFLQIAPIIENIYANDYSAFITQAMAEKNVRQRYGSHPRVKILGPIEARLSQFDVVIIGEANEGTWPHLPVADMWMSRPMKKNFGLPSPETAIGVMASDFAHLLNGPEVYITRAEKLDGVPSSKSRWLLRLETVLDACNVAKEILYDKTFSLWSKTWERAPLPLDIVKPPRPCPPVCLRPRRLSASNFEYLMRDPYLIFAKYILKLYKLEDLDKNSDIRAYGNVVHAVIEKFNNTYDKTYPQDAVDILKRLGAEEFEKLNISADIYAFWWSKFMRMINWLVITEKVYRQNIKQIFNEIEGKINFNAPAGSFEITAKADRIDITDEGSINVIDYKTGSARKAAEIATALAPQLPIEGLIAVKGGFGGIHAAKINSLRYWKLGDKEIICNETQSSQALERVENYIRELISLYDFPNQPYFAKPNPALAPAYSDYDHLSRYLEWSIRDAEDDNG